MCRNPATTHNGQYLFVMLEREAVVRKYEQEELRGMLDAVGIESGLMPDQAMKQTEAILRVMENFPNSNAIYFAECCLRMIPYNEPHMVDIEMYECEKRALAFLRPDIPMDYLESGGKL